ERGLHGKKGMSAESIREPLMVRYQRLLKRGQQCDALVANVDVAPSILDLCGVQAPLPMQGQSWRPLVTGKSGGPQRDSFVYSMHGPDSPTHPTVKGLRTERYKLILNVYPHDK